MRDARARAEITDVHLVGMIRAFLVSMPTVQEATTSAYEHALVPGTRYLTPEQIEHVVGELEGLRAGLRAGRKFFIVEDISLPE